MSADQIGQLLQTIVIMVAALSIVSGLRGVKNQIQVSAYLEYTKRFSEVYRPMRRALRKYEGIQSIKELSPDEFHDLRERVGSYFGLLASEFHLYKQGYIDQVTWQVWSEGVPRVVGNPLVYEFWLELKQVFAAVEGFESFIESKRK